jgi:hypothetical protein
MNRTDGLRIKTLELFLKPTGHIQLFEYNTPAQEATLSETKSGLTKHQSGSMIHGCCRNKIFLFLRKNKRHPPHFKKN